MKKILIILGFFFLVFTSPSYAANICEPSVNVDKQTFDTSVTFDVSNQGLPDGTTVKLRLDKNSIEYSTEVKNKQAIFDLNIINAGKHTFVIIVRGQGLCTSRGIDSTLTVPDAGQGSRTSILWIQAAGRSRTITCIQDPKGSFATKEDCEQDLKNKFPSAPPTPTPPPPPCTKFDSNGNCTEIDTALKWLSTNPGEFVKQIFGIVLSLAGGVSVILIILSGYRFISSGGNPEKLTAAKDQLVSAIVGLLFIIFSLSILQIIGVDILHIPGLSISK